jgi:succinate dehydrogenase / fumarate reductase iron-sulfur subunit
MDNNSITTKDVTFKVFRFNSETDYLPTYKEYKMEVTSEEVVLDILDRIKWDIDGSFSYRRSCRHGICGACAIKVNGKATLACKMNLHSLTETFGDELTIEPQSTKRAVKDMIIDKADFWEKHAKITPYLNSEIEEHPDMECVVSIEENDRIMEADLCIQCGACHYACPVVEINEQFIGPAAFVKAYRFEADIRDESHIERLEECALPDQGVWDCVKCFECAEACPKEINPIEKITALHQMIFKDKVYKNGVAERHAVGFAHSIKKHGLLDEGQLVLYSEGPSIVKHIPVALQMFKKGKIVMPWNMPKSDNLDEIQKLIKSSSTTKY